MPADLGVWAQEVLLYGGRQQRPPTALQAVSAVCNCMHCLATLRLRCLLAVEHLFCGHPCCRKVVDETVKKFGRVDILVNNASYQVREASLGAENLKLWETKNSCESGSSHHGTLGVPSTCHRNFAVARCQ